MKLTMISRVAAFGLFVAVEAVKHGHLHNLRHHHSATETEIDTPLEKRGGSCEFPSDAGLVSITPKMMNGGWAMSPDQPCKPGSYCPYACPPGQVSMQWDPKATSYSYPMSMNGGLYCDKDGKIKKPFPDRPYCKDGTGAVGVRNKCKGGDVSFCQTVLPGNEAMLIPTLVQEMATLAVPDPSYWVETAAHFYINPPGYGTEDACVWGTSSNPIGNWSPYVAGANTDSDGSTFLKIGWNPIYLEPATPFRNEVPEFGVEIECEGDGCNGLPCKIDPSVNKVNEMIGSKGDGAGGASFCVVTVPKGGKAHIVVFDKGGSGGGGGGGYPSSSSSTVSVSTSSSTILSSSTTSTTINSSTTDSSSTFVPSTATSTPSTTLTTSTISTPPPSPTSSMVISTSTPEPTLMPLPSRTPSSSAVSNRWPVKQAGYVQSSQVIVETKVSAYAGSKEEPTATSVPMNSNGGSGLEMSQLGLIIAVIAAIW
ncbi:hypothetical protein EYZ11_000007 [Aspergillus tanneri]|nr:hypothetical protein EYZ11_000007 [Aspergillus tanneri]